MKPLPLENLLEPTFRVPWPAGSLTFPGGCAARPAFPLRPAAHGSVATQSQALVHMLVARRRGRRPPAWGTRPLPLPTSQRGRGEGRSNRTPRPPELSPEAPSAENGTVLTPSGRGPVAGDRPPPPALPPLPAPPPPRAIGFCVPLASLLKIGAPTSSPRKARVGGPREFCRQRRGRRGLRLRCAAESESGVGGLPPAGPE